MHGRNYVDAILNKTRVNGHGAGGGQRPVRGEGIGAVPAEFSPHCQGIRLVGDTFTIWPRKFLFIIDIELKYSVSRKNICVPKSGTYFWDTLILNFY